MIDSQDKLNKKILSIMLSEKGISPRISELSRVLSRPRSTIDMRVKLLENNGIIVGYRPVINWEKLGFNIHGYVTISCSEDSVSSILEILKNNGSIEEVFEVTTGSFEVCAKCRFKNYSEINELRKHIKAVNGVKDIELFLLGPRHKGD